MITFALLLLQIYHFAISTPYTSLITHCETKSIPCHRHLTQLTMLQSDVYSLESNDWHL